jgi:hypothetical protein
MSSQPRGSKQGSQKDCRSNADTASTKDMSSSGRSDSLGGIESQTELANESEFEDTSSKPSFAVWGERENASRPTTGDKTTVAGIVADKLFQKAKFVNRDFDLGYDEVDGTICKFVNTNCNLQANIDVCTWWKEARKWIPTYMSCLQNNKARL